MNTYLFLILILISLVFFGFLIFNRPKKQQPPESLYTKALSAIIQGDKKIAIKHLRDVVKQDTSHIDAYLQIGNILREEGNVEGAIKIHRSLTLRPNLSKDIQRQIHKSLAIDYFKLGNISRAKEEAELVLKIDRKNFWVNDFLLQISEAKSDWKSAAQFSKTLQKLNSSKNPDQLSEYLVFEAMDRFKEGSRDEAINLLKKAVKTSPKLALPNKHLGDIMFENNDLKNAIAHWEKFVHYAPEKSNEVFPKIESAFFELGEFEEVEKFYNRILNQNPDNQLALINLANHLYQKGEYLDAKSILDDALMKNQESLTINLMKLKFKLKTSDSVDPSKDIDELLKLAKLSS